MEITVDTRPVAAIEADALVTYAFEQEKPVEGLLSQLDTAAGGALSKLAASGDNVLFKVGCEAGTYIRKLCHDIGMALGTGAHMQADQAGVHAREEVAAQA